MRLDDDQLAELARLIVDEMSRRASDEALQQKGLVSAAVLARALGVSRRFVYQRAEELGAVRLGSGPKAPLRFDLEQAKAAMARSASEQSHGRIASDDGRSRVEPPRRRRRLPDGLPAAGSVLALRPDSATPGRPRTGRPHPDRSVST